MNLHFEPITKQNQDDALRLRLADNQKGFVEPVEECLREARHCRRWHPVGIYDGDTMVGFAMYGYFFWQYLPHGKLWLDRLLIDEQYQGKGYGQASLSGLLTRLKSEYSCKKIYLSVIKDNQAAISLYEKFGFRFNGQRDIHGEYVMEYDTMVIDRTGSQKIQPWQH